ncbi:atypical chemokine receptor 1-like [Onychostruthus taczanowskii]|uniref:atypical chemokine receptor 1-like n=1 Tax=Onychostruthus taczanowskii TaxID=356909 RepID=UPI001B805E08|nr:atypical chemokine receptor 1-like [Onychostruthus taczanowskii]
MGNCVPVTPGILETPDSLDLGEITGNLSSFYDDDTYINDTLLDYDATPCHNRFCPLFQRVAPPFLAATCAAAALATGALLVALAKRPQAWRWPQSRALVAQLALGTALFAALLPALAAGAARGWHLGTGLCRLTHLLWHWSVFAQALLVASGSCGTAWARWDPRSRRLAVALWAAALLLATPAALVSGVAAGTACVRRSVGILAPAYLLHLALCLCLLLLLPAGLLVAALCPRASGAGLAWLFLGLWGPYGAGLAGEFVLQAGLLEPTCGSFEHFDIALGLSEGLGVLHCGLGPLALLLARSCRRDAGAAGGC